MRNLSFIDRLISKRIFVIGTIVGELQNLFFNLTKFPQNVWAMHGMEDAQNIRSLPPPLGDHSGNV